MDGISAAKAQARSRVRARRRQLVEGQSAQARAGQAGALAAAFLDWAGEYAVGPGRAGLPGLTVTAFRPLRSEPPVGELVQAALRAGVRVLLPVTVRDDPELHWVPATADTGDAVPEEVMRGVALAGDELGPAALREVDVALVPGLAVDAAGHRLGQGGGYYDRALPLLRPGVPVIVALHDHEAPTDRPGETLPHEPHDIRVHGVLTTAGVRLLRRPGPTGSG